jgi:hypothetical protein
MRLNRSRDNFLRLRAAHTEFTVRSALSVVPSGQFQTFLITKFNVYDTKARAEVAYRFGLQSEKDFEDWFLSRIDLFLEVTAPSVQAMTQPPEVWLLMVDEAMPGFAEQLQKKVAHIPYARLCPIPRPVQPRTSCYYSNAALSAHIAKLLRKDAHYVMTILLDNDDCLHRDYIKNALLYAGLLGEEELKSAHVINFPHGLRWDRDFVSAMTLYSNPYLAFVEPAQWYKSAPNRHLTGYQRRHGVMNQCGLLHDYPLEEPMWLRLYHDTNWLRPEFGADGPQPLQNIEAMLEKFGLKHLAPPKPSYPYVLAAKQLRRGGDVKESTTMLRKAQELSPDWATLTQEEASLLESARDFPAAIDACRRWVALAKEHPYVLYQAGLACLRMGEERDGQGMLEKAFAE